MPIRRAFLVLLASFLVVVPSAQAGSPGKWTQLGQANLDNIDEAALARTADGVLHVVWTIPSHNNGGNGDDLVHDAVAPNGVASPVNPITTSWAGITAVPDVVTTPDGGLRAFFGGIRTTNPNEPNNELNTATAPASGATWNLFLGPVAQGDAAYAGDDGATLLNDGTPIFGFGGTGTGAFVHRGLDPHTPNYNLQSQLGSCCGYSPDIGVDTQTGAAFVVWYSNATNKSGVFAQSLDPATGQPSGPPALMPGTVTPFGGVPSSSQQLTRTPIAARVGGGVFAAYGGGYPTTNKVLYWHIAGSKSSVIGTSAHDHIVSLTAAPDGRMWVFWIERDSPRPLVFARRSNKSGLDFGPAVKIGGPAGQDSVYRIAGNAQAAILDIVADFGSGNAIAQWHTQVMPGLGLVASPSKIKAGKTTAVKFTVTDPDAVKGATVSAGGHSAKTDSKGHATIDLGPTKKHSIAATATKAGYGKGTAKVKVSS